MSKYFDYPCLCLCFGLQQITMIRPRLRINRHFSHILRMEARIFVTTTLNYLDKSIDRFEIHYSFLPN